MHLMPCKAVAQMDVCFPDPKECSHLACGILIARIERVNWQAAKMLESES